MLASSTGGGAARRVVLSTLLSAPLVSTLAANANAETKEQRKYQVSQVAFVLWLDEEGLGLDQTLLLLLSLLHQKPVEISDDKIHCCYGRPGFQQWYWRRDLGIVGG